MSKATSSEMIAITIGDPSGVGPEIVAKAIDRADAATRARLRVVCHESWFGQQAALLSCDVGGVRFEDCSRETDISDPGAAQVAYLERAARLARDGEVSALVTAPIHKGRARAAGFEFIGHTEFLAARLGAERVAMMFAGPNFRAVLSTIHVPLTEVSAALTHDAVTNAIELGIEALTRDFSIANPRVAVLGLNPHAGEGGLLGREEIEVITPAIESARLRYPDAVLFGPVVPDVAFRQPADLYIAMYHDQALIPLKLRDFDSTVNVTLGLPIIRTSPDHGTADDIAGRGVARADSLCAALDLALEMLASRQ